MGREGVRIRPEVCGTAPPRAHARTTRNRRWKASNENTSQARRRKGPAKKPRKPRNPVKPSHQVSPVKHVRDAEQAEQRWQGQQPIIEMSHRSPRPNGSSGQQDSYTGSLTGSTFDFDGSSDATHDAVTGT